MIMVSCKPLAIDGSHHNKVKVADPRTSFHIQYNIRNVHAQKESRSVIQKPNPNKINKFD